MITSDFNPTFTPGATALTARRQASVQHLARPLVLVLPHRSAPQTSPPCRMFLLAYHKSTRAPPPYLQDSNRRGPLLSGESKEIRMEHAMKRTYVSLHGARDPARRRHGRVASAV